MSDLKLEVGARVRLVRDIVGEAPDSSDPQPPRVYNRKGEIGIVDSIHPNPEELDSDECPVGVRFGGWDYSEDYVDFEDIEVIESAADVAKEPKEFTVTGQIVVEVTHRIMARGVADAAKLFREMKNDLIQDWDEMEVIKVKKIDPSNIAEKGYDY